MSYITVPAEKVREAAQAVIDRIVKVRQDGDEKAISQQMSKKHWIWFGEYYTLEESIKYLANTETFFPSIYAWGDLRIAKILLIMAQNGDPVMVDNDDARVLWVEK